tara:strand:- start:155 stop:364 length:210 start_codon:yes stop_codon:yes gene_type:complete
MNVFELVWGLAALVVFLLLCQYISRLLELNFFITVAFAVFGVYILFYLTVLIADRRRTKSKDDAESLPD